MCINDRNYFELCNEILGELYFEEVEYFEELDEIEEGRRVKRLLNRALKYICNNEEGAWSFRELEQALIPTKDVKHYDKPNGFIEYIKYPKNNIVLTYIDDHKYTVSNTKGMPISYWMHNNKIRLYPTPDHTYNDNELSIHFLTNDYAKDCCGFYKPQMVYETDTPIIPNHHRDILVYKVCADWRTNAGDAQSVFFKEQYKNAYRALLSDCRQTEDLNNGLHISGQDYSYTEQMLDAFNNPYTISRPEKGN